MAKKEEGEEVTLNPKSKVSLKVDVNKLSNKLISKQGAFCLVVGVIFTLFGGLFVGALLTYMKIVDVKELIKYGEGYYSPLFYLFLSTCLSLFGVVMAAFSKSS
ncbi:MAG: hypothetical protein AMQ74_01734 [Candidatus Methanofastidiosum methylothiophilum]|uniref:Uncharacterized protein n=1 Tax=Candidatus Methanofastidiosum methylothiophilum TaxID=1705564 RepID=A0A150IPL9_9EURY|nr:MAG: hypothetical protein AMQ74_01734 [Candidatus Methanofastidiosum methylthiophilus]